MRDNVVRQAGEDHAAGQSRARLRARREIAEEHCFLFRIVIRILLPQGVRIDAQLGHGEKLLPLAILYPQIRPNTGRPRALELFDADIATA
ncbi:MAG: hypothetical protein R3F11_17270 [Verrucomicrobiales bacterium]